MSAGMATSKYLVAPPSIGPLLHEFGDYDAIPEDAWREYIAAMAYWSRTWLMYAGPADKTRKRRAPPAQPPPQESEQNIA
jgi:hypothetical protein